MPHVIFRCPSTNLNVQHWQPDEQSGALRADDAEAYEAVTCPACTKLHFLNMRTAKLLGDDGA